MNLILVRMAVVVSSVLLVTWGEPSQAEAASALYPRMASLDQYLMTDRDVEVAMARSAAPKSVSGDAASLLRISMSAAKLASI